MLPAFRYYTVNQVAGAARTGQFARMTDEINPGRAANILMRCTDAPARRHAAAITADGRLEDDAAHQMAETKIMAGFLPSIDGGVAAGSP